MAGTYVGQSSRFHATDLPSTNTNVAVLAGDILVCFHQVSNGGGATRITPPPVLTAGSTCTATAFTEVFTGYEVFEMDTICYRATVLTDGNALVEVPITVVEDNAISLVALRGVNASPIVQWAYIGTATATPATTAVTPAVGDVVLSGAFMRGGGTGALWTGTGSPFTVASELENGSFWEGPTIVEYFEADATTPVAGAPTLNTTRKAVAFNLLFTQATDPGPTLARGLYL